VTVRLEAGEDDAGRRLDRVLRRALPGLPLSLVHRLLRQGKVAVDGEPAGPGTRVRPGSAILVAAPVGPPGGPSGPAEGGPRGLPPLPEVLARGAGVVIFNKPAGLASHGPGSLDEAVKARLAGKAAASLSFRPGPLHRLDRSTSGAIAFSESLAGARLFSGLLRERGVARAYLAIAEGRIPGGVALWRDDLLRDRAARKTLAASAGEGRAKAAETSVRALAAAGRYTLVEARIATGRTHQIRAQAAARGCPLAGDAKYGASPLPGCRGFFLHAWKIEFGAEVAGLPRVVVAPPPGEFMELALSAFGRQSLEGLFRL